MFAVDRLQGLKLNNRKEDHGGLPQNVRQPGRTAAKISENHQGTGNRPRLAQTNPAARTQRTVHLRPGQQHRNGVHLLRTINQNILQNQKHRPLLHRWRTQTFVGPAVHPRPRKHDRKTLNNYPKRGSRRVLHPGRQDSLRPENQGLPESHNPRRPERTELSSPVLILHSDCF